jgi:TonB-dependent Receptor Plug Domain
MSRWFRVALCCCSLGLCLHVGAQIPTARVVKFSCVDCTPEDALKELSTLADIGLSFNPNIFEGCPNVTVASTSLSIAEILDKITACQNLDWKWENQQVLVFKLQVKYQFATRLMDKSDKQQIIGANVSIWNEKDQYVTSRITDEFGYVSFELPAGAYHFSFFQHDYEPLTKEVQVRKSQTMEVTLSPRQPLSGVVIKGDSTGLVWTHRSSDAALQVPNYMIKSAVTPIGLADPHRVASFVPGVQTGVDGIGGLNVRGGNADQNLILLDDAPVYVATHAFGLVSVFNNDLLANLKIWKGDAPARYSGRTGGVLDVRTRDGSLERWSGGLNLGPFAGSAIVEGPLLRNRAACIVAFKHSYLSPWIRNLESRPVLFDAPSNKLQYRFGDLNAKFNWQIDTLNRLYLSFYHGSDQLATPFSLVSNRIDNFTISDNLNLGTDWGNFVSTLRWNHLFSEKLSLNTMLRFSRFNYNSELNRVTNSINTNTGRTELLANYEQNYRTFIQDLSLKSDLTNYNFLGTLTRMGGSLTYHTFRPGITTINENNSLTILQNQNLIANLIDSLRNVETPQSEYKNLELELYIETEIKIKPWLMLQAGLSTTTLFAKDTVYVPVNPQMRLTFAGKRKSAWVSVNRSAQTIHQIGSFNSNLPFELWVPSTRFVRPQTAWQLAAGASYEWRGWSVLGEAYWKKMKHVLTMVSDANVLLNGGVENLSGWEHSTLAGNGKAFGYEFTMEKKYKRYSGSMNYAWSKSVRQFDDLNEGQPFPFRFDRRHEIKINMQYRMCKRISLSATWLYSSGTPITMSGSRYINVSGKEDAFAREVHVFGSINGFRLPAFHRLDLAANVVFPSKKRLKHELQVSFFNCYNRHNVLYLQRDLSAQTSDKAIAYTLFPFLPAIRYAIRF